MGDHFKGAERIQQIIHQLFQSYEEVDDHTMHPITVGVYGMSGSGKTTLCKFMLNFYNKELYPVRCCFLQFPSREEDENQLLVQSMKDVLSACCYWTKESLDKINIIQQAMPLLQELLKRYKVFLVLDNVCDWSSERAKQIVTMDYIRGSRLLVTARSENMLQSLSSRRVHVPSISEEEAIQVLMAYSFTSLGVNAEDLQGLARSCFFDEQCHPLLLRAMGAKLRHLGPHARNTQEWTQLMSRLQVHVNNEEIEETVLKVLRTTFNALHSKLQKTFLYLGTCVPKLVLKGPNSWRDGKHSPTEYKSLLGSSEWLRKLSRIGSCTSKEIRDQIVELEYKGLIQIHEGDVVIHDLQMMLIESIVRENAGAPRCFFFEGDVATLLANDRRRHRYICGYLEEGTDWKVLSTGSKFPDMEVLHLQQRSKFPDMEVLHSQQRLGFSGRNRGQHPSLEHVLSLKHMQSLRHLELNNITSLKELRGWNGAPNLVSVTLTKCHNLQKIESMACLGRLESLAIEYCMSYQYNGNLVKSENLKRLVIQGQRHLDHSLDLLEFILGHLPNVLELEISECENWMRVGRPEAFSSLQNYNMAGTGINNFWGHSITLRVLDLSRCQQLEYMGGSFNALEELYLSSCPNLIFILTLPAKLRRLDVDYCDALTEVMVGDATLTSLESLSLQDDISLQSLVSISSPLAISAFTNLRTLFWVGGRYRYKVLGSTLPPSLQGLILCDFESLEEITGLDYLTNLLSLDILSCPSLIEVGHWKAPFISNLSSVYIEDCLKLESLSTMRYLTSLKSFSIQNSPMVQMGTLPRGLKQFHDWDI